MFDKLNQTTIDQDLLDRLEAALRPFAECCFNDNRDFTVSTDQTKRQDFIRAYDAYQELTNP